MAGYYKLSRGLGKKEIGIALYHCWCGKTMGLLAVDDGNGKKVYRCKEHAQGYRSWKDKKMSDYRKKVNEAVKKIEALKFNEPLDSEMRIVNMIANSAIKIVREVFK